jgi:hypothetical protein
MPNKSNTVLRFQDNSTLDISTLVFSIPDFSTISSSTIDFAPSTKESGVEKSRDEI